MTRSKSPTPTVEPEAAVQPAISIEVVEDRYAGLIGTPGNIDKKLGLALLDTVGRLIEKTARIESFTERDEAAWLMDDILAAVRRMVVQGVHERGLAR